MKLMLRIAASLLVGFLLISFAAAPVEVSAESDIGPGGVFADSYYVYLYGDAGEMFYITPIFSIGGKSEFDNAFIEMREARKKQFINRVKADSGKQLLMTDVYVIVQQSHQDYEDLKAKRLEEISRQEERGKNVRNLNL